MPARRRRWECRGARPGPRAFGQISSCDPPETDETNLDAACASLYRSGMALQVRTCRVCAASHRRSNVRELVQSRQEQLRGIRSNELSASDGHGIDVNRSLDPKGWKSRAVIRQRRAART